MELKTILNRPCECASGRRWVNCCGRNAPKPYEIVKDIIANEPLPACMAPTNKKRGCRRTPIRSHTIGRSFELKSIAHDGKVYGTSMKASALVNGRRRPFELVPTSQASVFPGFCKEHDAELFRVIDESGWKDSAEQKFLLGYRALARELYAKVYSQAAMNPSPKRSGVPHNQLYAAAVGFATDESLKEIQQSKRIADKEIVRGTFSCFAEAINLGDTFPIRMAGVISPEFDFNGERCFHTDDYSVPLQHLCLSTRRTNDGVLAVFVWFVDSSEIRQFVDSFMAITPDRQGAAFAQLCFEYCEHTYFEPRWWESLAPQTQRQIERRFLESAVPEHLRSKHSLAADATYLSV